MLLSPSSGMWFSSYNLPLPGHVLICGPTVSPFEFLSSLFDYLILEGQRKLLMTDRFDVLGMGKMTFMHFL